MQGFNMGRYVPPDLEGTTTGNALHKKHPLGARARHLQSTGSLTVRFEMPFATWCTNCKPETLIGQGVRFNAEKKKVGHYYSTPVYSFRFKHSACGAWMEIRTDPKNTAYVVTEGGRRRDYGVDEEGNAVGEILVGKGKGGELGGGDDPFSKIEGKVEDKRVVDEARSRILQLQRRQDRDWDDPYEVSRRLRRGFRAERKVLEKKEEGKEALREKMSLGIEIVDETEEDRVRASMVDFEDATGAGKGSLRTRALFEKAIPASASSSLGSGSGDDGKIVKGKNGKRKAADLVAERKALFRNELTGNTRAAVDPFLNEADGWQAGVKKRKAFAIKVEGKRENKREAADSPSAFPSETVQKARVGEPKNPAVSTLVDYGSDSE
ncbi:CWC16 protein [Aspergillus heterothallicus]